MIQTVIWILLVVVEVVVTPIEYCLWILFEIINANYSLMSSLIIFFLDMFSGIYMVINVFLHVVVEVVQIIAVLLVDTIDLLVHGIIRVLSFVAALREVLWVFWYHTEERIQSFRSDPLFISNWHYYFKTIQPHNSFNNFYFNQVFITVILILIFSAILLVCGPPPLSVTACILQVASIIWNVWSSIISSVKALVIFLFCIFIQTICMISETTFEVISAAVNHLSHIIPISGNQSSRRLSRNQPAQRNISPEELYQENLQRLVRHESGDSETDDVAAPSNLTAHNPHRSHNNSERVSINELSPVGTSRVPDELETSEAGSGSKKNNVLENILQQVQEERERHLCVICQDREKTVLLMPCRHLCLCEVCGDQIFTRRECPMCRNYVRDTVTVYM